MKARVKATGETVEIMQVYEKGESFYVRLDMLDTTEIRYHISELEFEGFEIPTSPKKEGGVVYIDPTIDYWTRLEHTYAGMAMQGILANSAFDEVSVADIAITSIKVATSLIKRLKEERK